MYRHILIPTDGSAQSEAAIEHGIGLAQATRAKVTALTVSAADSIAREDANRILAAVAKAATVADVPCELLQVEHDQPYRAILDAARARGCDVIVMASHGRHGVAALLLGSETLKVLTHGTVPVIVVRGQHPGAFFAAS